MTRKNILNPMGAAFYELTIWSNNDCLLSRFIIKGAAAARAAFNGVELAAMGGNENSAHCAMLVSLGSYETVGLHATAAAIAKYGHQVKDF